MTTNENIRCPVCGHLLIRRATAPWEIDCRHCKNTVTATGDGKRFYSKTVKLDRKPGNRVKYH